MTSVTIKHQGIKVTFENKQDLQDLRNENPSFYNGIRTSNAQLLTWAYELYLDELARQDNKGSHGSYGKHAEVWARVSHALNNGKPMYLHDVRCRRQNMDDQRIAGTRIEHKTGFAQWEYGASYAECMEKLKRRAAAGIVMIWEPFKDERRIEMPLSDLLAHLASYNPDKGLAVWFSFKPAKGQLQIQPVIGISKKRERFILEMLGE